MQLDVQELSNFFFFERETAAAKTKSKQALCSDKADFLKAKYLLAGSRSFKI